MTDASSATQDVAFSQGILAEPASDDALMSRAQALSTELGWPVVNDDEAQQMELILAVTAARLELRWADPQEQQQLRGRKTTDRSAGLLKGQPIFADWDALNVGRGAGVSLKQPIAKAVGLKSLHAPGPCVIDATAGWGEDAWLMASLGCTVVMVERNAVIATLLRDAITRAARHSPRTASRLSVVHADAIEYLRSQPAGAQVIHLDPMFPGEKTAAQKKPMRLLRRLVGEDGDANLLFESAWTSGAPRIAVKRPPHAPTLGDKPSIVHEGKASRYDIYLR
jgi:16S rRNA (guanine1516-N2)-methyltransferase